MTDLVYKAMNVVWKGCVGVGLVAAAAAFALFYFQDNILYIPDPDKRMPKLTTHNPPHYRSPAEYTVRGNYKSKSSTEQTIPYIEDFVTTTDGEKIHVWLMYHQNVTWAVPTLVSSLPVLMSCLFFFTFVTNPGNLDLFSWQCCKHGIQVEHLCNYAELNSFFHNCRLIF